MMQGGRNVDNFFFPQSQVRTILDKLFHCKLCQGQHFTGHWKCLLCGSTCRAGWCW